ncbi:MAG TPA: amidase family protein [Opitutaceae bacterium]
MNHHPRLRRPLATLLFASFGLLISTGARAAELKIEDATIADLNAAFQAGTLTAEKLTEIYLARITAYDKQGPAINTVIALNPKALDEARALDAERKAGKVRGPLHGVPIVLKDNFDTFDLPTTAGSQLLDGHLPPDDAFVVKKLRDAGAIILAKVNLSEFAGGGGSVIGATDPAILKAGSVPNGFSSMGLQTLNPHDLARGPAGSSGGTGAAIAAAFAQFGLGTDTGGSIRGPSAANGIVGLKPTHGLLSRDGIVPISTTFDTGGPMGRSVYDIAVALGVMTGVDAADTATNKSIGKFETDYTRFLKRGSLKGARIGVARDFFGKDPGTDQVMAQAIATLKELGAVIVDPVTFPDYVHQAKRPLMSVIAQAEFKAQIADYLESAKPRYPKTLDDLAARANDPASGYRSPEKAFAFKYHASKALELDDPVYLAAKNEGIALVKVTIEGIFSKHQLDALIYPTGPRPAALIERGVPSSSADSATNFANLTGFPDLIVPAGMTPEGLPVTLSFFGKAFSEPKLLGYAYDFEQASHARVLPKHTPSLPGETISF